MSLPLNNYKLGLFTLGGLALLILGVLAFGARGWLERNSVFETYVAGDVTGLAVGSAVELRGVRVGKVRAINFSWNEYQETQPSYVVVEFEMGDDVTPLPPGEARSEMLRSAVKRGLRARLKPQGITGTSFLSIEYLNPDDNPPAQVPWTPRHTYIPAAPGQIGELLASIDRTLRNVEHLDLGALNQLLQNDLKSAGVLISKAGQVDYAGLSTNASELLTGLQVSNAKLQSFIADTNDTVKKMTLVKLARDLDGLAGQLQSAAGQLSPGLAKIDFDALNQTVENARRTLQEADDVLFELKQDPAGFLFGKPPAVLQTDRPPVIK